MTDFSDYPRGGYGGPDCKPLSMADCAEMFQCGIDHIKEHGWVQQRGGNEAVGLCAQGSLQKAFVDDPVPDNKQTFCEKYQGSAKIPEPVVMELTRITGFNNLPDFNDVPGRTKDQVLDVMNKLRDFASQIAAA